MPQLKECSVIISVVLCNVNNKSLHHQEMRPNQGTRGLGINVNVMTEKCRYKS